MLQHILATLALLGLALLLGATAYESVVLAPNYGRDVPESLNHARRFFARTTPASYFRVVAPATLALLGAGLVACWRILPARWGMLGGTAALGISDMITFTFHYPRLALMFRSPPDTEPELLRRASVQWAAGNLVRGALLTLAFLSVLWAVITVSR